MGSLVAVSRVHQLLPDGDTGDVTGIDKRPVEGPVRAGPFGLRGDVQADRRDHGGPDRALYAYAHEELDHWAAELGRDLAPGLFGENLLVRGVDVDEALVGERWRIGGEVEVEVTMARTPCQTFARRLGEQHWVRRFTERGRPGAYLRVLAAGPLAAGDAVQVLSRPDHGVSVSAFFRDRSGEQAVALLAAEEAGDLRLADDIRPSLDRALLRA